jgi:hypothetical protein
MARRVLPALFLVLAAYADARGAHGLAFYALLGAVPFTAVAALVSFGSHLERRTAPASGLHALLWVLALCLLVVSCAARSPEAATGVVPPLGASALVACLAVFALKALLVVAPYARLALRPAKP